MWFSLESYFLPQCYSETLRRKLYLSPTTRQDEMGVIWRTLSHARQPQLGISRLLSQTTRQYHLRVSSNTRWRLRSSTSRFAWTFLFAGISLYAFFEYFAVEDDHGKKFQPYFISEKEFYSRSSSIFKLKSQQEVDWSKQWQNGLWSVEIKQPQLQIAREYTPLPAEIGQHVNGIPTLAPGHQDQGTLEFWIRREPHGEVSNYLHSLELSDLVQVRGPKSKTAIPEAQEFLFIAGGTGISPAIQLAHALLAKCGGPNDLPKVSILWANRNRQDCLGGVSDSIMEASLSLISRLFTSTHAVPVNSKKAYLVTRLDSLKKAFNGKLQVDYYVDEESTRIRKHDILSRLEADRGGMVNASKRVVMVCGPDGFVAHFAGHKRWSNGQQTQGEITGVLQDAGQMGWDVIKL